MGLLLLGVGACFHCCVRKRRHTLQTQWSIVSTRCRNAHARLDNPGLSHNNTRAVRGGQWHYGCGRNTDDFPFNTPLSSRLFQVLTGAEMLEVLFSSFFITFPPHGTPNPFAHNKEQEVILLGLYRTIPMCVERKVCLGGWEQASEWKETGRDEKRGREMIKAQESWSNRRQ